MTRPAAVPVEWSFDVFLIRPPKTPIWPLEWTARCGVPGAKAACVISVLVVDDSVVIRRLITDALAEDPQIQVIGTAPNGRVALQKIGQLKPDLVTLDVEMPVLDGLSTLRELRRTDRVTPVIMFSTLTAAGAMATLDALSAGASDYVTKPANVGSIRESIRSVREQLIPRIHALCERRVQRRQAIPGAPGQSNRAPLTALQGSPATLDQAPTRPGSPPVTLAPARPGLRERLEVIAIGCSTGGPDALTQVVQTLPANLPVPIVVVQHMPPVFTKMFAERLDRLSTLQVVEAVTDTPLRPGTVYVAPGDLHLEVARNGAEVVTRLQTGAPENFCRPAADVLFRSVAQVFGGHVLAVVLTGMGHDGRSGCEALLAAGAEVVVQDEATSVVWGMPGAVAQAGLAHAVLPLKEIASHLISRCAGGRGARAMEVTR
jgi:two-component system, chemotaxis family, protein-glutamate methylesterase/glutaminase